MELKIYLDNSYLSTVIKNSLDDFKQLQIPVNIIDDSEEYRKRSPYKVYPVIELVNNNDVLYSSIGLEDIYTVIDELKLVIKATLTS